MIEQACAALSDSAPIPVLSMGDLKEGMVSLV